MTNAKMDIHNSKVQEIANKLHKKASYGEKAHIDKGGVQHVVPLPGDTRRAGKPIKIQELKEILEIDTKKQICCAEPGVTFSRLVKETLPLGLMPKVVPELEGITLGGAVAGCSVESMSYRYGGFHDSCLEYEIIKTDGEIITVSKDSFLFEMIHGSYGTLGILSKLTFELIPAKPYIYMQYKKFPCFEEFQKALYEHCQKGDYPFIDAIVHGPKEFVLCLGDFTDSPPYISNYRWLNIFYKSTRKRTEDYLSLYDYFFRYDTECHWLTKTIPALENKLVRFLIGKFVLGSTNLIAWAKRLEFFLKLKRRPEVVCDVFIPAKRFQDFFDWYKKDFDFYPLWVIPYSFPKLYPWLNETYARNIGGSLVIDCAIYGKINNLKDIDYSQILEEKTVELNGIKTLISRNHFTKEKFWSIYNQSHYEKAKSILDPKGIFPDVYKKFHRK
ncbi:MAG: FAD-binding oxidoreductase [Candidatus Brocadiae bacterium]|nr:FAD-binding oxidoreductase [Candidatus Brocadiia bacterium]